MAQCPRRGRPRRMARRPQDAHFKASFLPGRAQSRRYRLIKFWYGTTGSRGQRLEIGDHIIRRTLCLFVLHLDIKSTICPATDIAISAAHIRLSTFEITSTDVRGAALLFSFVCHRHYENHRSADHNHTDTNDDHCFSCCPDSHPTCYFTQIFVCRDTLNHQSDSCSSQATGLRFLRANRAFIGRAEGDFWTCASMKAPKNGKASFCDLY